MTASQEEAFQKLQDSIISQPITYLAGIAGTGKSFLCNELSKNLSDRVLDLRLDGFDGEFSPDIYAYLLSQIEQNFQDSFVETYYNISRTREILEELHDNNNINFNELEEYLSIKENYSYHFYNNSHLEEYFSSEDEAKSKFLKNIKKLSFESFLVDIYSLFLKENLEEKITVRIIIDENDNMLDELEGSIINFFNQFSQNPKFEFYDFDEIRDTKITELVDFRLLISSRKDLSQNSIKLQLPTDLEVQKILLDNGFNPDEIDQLQKTTKNNFHIITHCIDENQIDKKVLYPEFLKYFYKYLNDKELYLMSSLSAFEEFDSNALKLLQYDLDAKSDYQYLTSRTEYFEETKNLLRLNRYYSSLILDTIETTDPEFNSELENYYKVYNTIKPIIYEYGQTNFELIRHLAYFKRFSSSDILLQIFDDSFKNEIKKLQQITLIIKDSYNYTLQEATRENLFLYNQLADKSHFDTKLNLVTKIWSEKENSLKIAKNDFALELNQILIDAKSLRKEIKAQESEIEKIKTETTESEELLSKVSKKHNHFKHTQPIKITLSLLLISILLMSIGIIGELAFDESIIYLILIGLGLVSLIYNFTHLRKIYIRKKNKKEIAKLKSDLEKIESHLNQLNKNSEIIKADLVASSHKLREIEKDIKIFEKDLNIIEAKLNEPFTY